MEDEKKQINRLRYFDYSNPAYYFLTFNSHLHKRIFGSVKNAKMNFSEFGKIANRNLLEIPRIWSHTELDEFVVMPNHIHLILIVNEVSDASYASESSTSGMDDYDRTKMTVSKIIQQYKSVCTKEIKRIDKNISKVWMKSFYDRIIRNERELYFMRRYIRRNPLKWDLEKNSP